MKLKQLIGTLDQLRQTRDELQRQTASLRSQFRRLQTPLLLLNNAAMIEQSNPTFDATLGYAAKEVVGWSFYDFCTPKQAIASRERLQGMMQDIDAAVVWPVRLQHKDSRRKLYRVSARVVRFADDVDRLLIHCAPRDYPESVGLTLADNDTGEDQGIGAAAEPTLSTNRPVLGKDLMALPERLGCSTTRCCNLLGVATMAYYDWRSRPDEPVPNRTVALHVRLLDAFPALAAIDYGPDDLQQGMERTLGRRVTMIELSLLLGMERTSGYRWGRGVPPAEMATALIGSLGELVETRPPAALAVYRDLVEAEARAIGIDDLWEQGNWKVPQRESKKRS